MQSHFAPQDQLTNGRPVPTIEEFQVYNGANPAEVHSLYWTNETVLSQAAELLQRNL